MKFNDIIAIVKSVILKNYFNFKGRATRSEFWWFFLFYGIVTTFFGLFGKVGRILNLIWSLGMLMPVLGVGARRLHDINKPGTRWLMGLIPIAGPIILILDWVKVGDAQENQYGPVPTMPKAEPAAAPAEPAAPETPAEPAAPAEPVAPETPAEPVAPEAPVEPTAPEAPVEPTAPETPVEPEAPTTPETPAE